MPQTGNPRQDDHRHHALSDTAVVLGCVRKQQLHGNVRYGSRSVGDVIRVNSTQRTGRINRGGASNCCRVVVCVSRQELLNPNYSVLRSSLPRVVGGEDFFTIQFMHNALCTASPAVPSPTMRSKRKQLGCRACPRLKSMFLGRVIVCALGISYEPGNLHTTILRWYLEQGHHAHKIKRNRDVQAEPQLPGNTSVAHCLPKHGFIKHLKMKHFGDETTEFLLLAPPPPPAWPRAIHRQYQRRRREERVFLPPNGRKP